MREPTEADLRDYLQRLLESDWESPGSALVVAGDLEPAEVDSILFLDQTRQFLRFVVERDGVGITPGGWLKRAVVADAVRQLDWPRREAEGLPPAFKQINEYDVKPLAVMRDVCECGRLLLKRRDRLHVPQRVLPLLAAGAGGRLYRRLFIALFRDAGTDCVYGQDSVPWIDDTMAVTLWRLSLVAQDWLPLERCIDELLLDPVKEQLESYHREFPELRTAMVLHRVVEPLSWFGLLELDRAVARFAFETPGLWFRKTPLFDRFVRFPPFALGLPAQTN